MSKTIFGKYSLLKTIFCIPLVLVSCADYDLLDTLEEEPEPVSLSISAVGDSSVTLNWSKSEEDDFTNYKVYYSLNDVVDTTSTLSATLTFRNDVNKTVKNLTPGRHYYFRVIVTTRRGLISTSNTVDTTTTSKGKITLHAPNQISTHSVGLQWTPDEKSNVVSYEVYYDTVQTVSQSSTLALTIADTVATVDLLESGKKYWFRVYGLDNVEVRAVSNVVSGTTLE